MDTKEWDDLDKRYITIMGRWFWLTVIMVVALFLFLSPAFSAPIYQADQEGVKIVLFDEDCKLKEVTNLKKRATWTEKGRTYEGCYGGHPFFPIVMGYFSDRTVVALPSEIFIKVHGT